MEQLNPCPTTTELLRGVRTDETEESDTLKPEGIRLGCGL